MMLKNRWKKAACLILTIISTVCLGKVDVKAADYWPDAPETLSPGVILMERVHQARSFMKKTWMKRITRQVSQRS